MTRSRLVLGIAAVVVSGVVDDGWAQNRLRRSIEGPVTRQAVTRSLAVVPADVGDQGGVLEVSVTLRIEFDFDSAELSTHARVDLESVAAALNGREMADVRLTIEGHTDAHGSADYNRALSQRRADAVTSYLVQQGVAGSRLRSRGFGESRPLPEYAPTGGMQRRVEIVRAF